MTDLEKAAEEIKAVLSKYSCKLDVDSTLWDRHDERSRQNHVVVRTASPKTPEDYHRGVRL